MKFFKLTLIAFLIIESSYFFILLRKCNIFKDLFMFFLRGGFFSGDIKDIHFHHFLKAKTTRLPLHQKSNKEEKNTYINTLTL